MKKKGKLGRLGERGEKRHRDRGECGVRMGKKHDEKVVCEKGLYNRKKKKRSKKKKGMDEQEKRGGLKPKELSNKGKLIKTSQEKDSQILKLDIGVKKRGTQEGGYTSVVRRRRKQGQSGEGEATRFKT